MKLTILQKFALLSIAALTLVLAAASFKADQTQAASGLQCVKSTNDLISSTDKNFGNCFATSTFLYMTAGTATSTLTFYSQNIDNVGIDIAFQASSTASKLNWRRETSPNAIDWYAVGDIIPTVQSTSTAVTVDYSETSWQYASSTAGTSNGRSTALKHVDVFNLQSPYTRFVFYMPAGSTAGGFHAHIFGKVVNTI